VIKLGRIKDHFFDEINNDDDGYDKYLADLEIARAEAEYYIISNYEIGNIDGELRKSELFSIIWYASTEILPKLEVQVMIDSEDKIFVSTGTAGYVDFKIDPAGMKLPIKCWIHTHPFGAAYFSGTDINSVSSWEPLLKEAYVLGGEGHYGSWSQEEPNELQIYRNNVYKETQVWNKGSEEE
jgi:proteasome lid subunit RPN8/RPN11|tara:strand:+ start:1025 stop:1570 length:546 start_codon:yes stop_codon:yes gene_type:complete